MENLVLLAQGLIAISIFNVWILRFGKSTNWRGGTAQNMREEFEVYGLPGWFLILIFTLKLSFAALLLTGLWLPAFTKPAAFGMAVLMLGAVAMHLKVKDPLLKSLPAFSLLALSVFVATV